MTSQCKFGFASSSGGGGSTDPVAVRGTPLTGLTPVHGTVAATDTIIQGFNKLAYDQQNPELYSGCTTLPAYVDNGDGTVTWDNTGRFNLRSVTDLSGAVTNYAVNGGTFTPTNNAKSYMYVDYNSGTPVMGCDTAPAINGSSIIAFAEVIRTGSVLHDVTYDSPGRGLAEKSFNADYLLHPFRRYSGLGLIEESDRIIIVESGVVFVGVQRQTVLEARSDTAASCRLYYHSSGSWTSAAFTQYNNTQYDNGTNLATLSNGRYAVIFVYRGIEDQTHIYCTLGTGSYTLTQAQAAQPQTPPFPIAGHALLVGKIIVLKNATSATEIQSAFVTQFTQSGSVQHNDTTGRDEAGNHTIFQPLTDTSTTYTWRKADGNNAMYFGTDDDPMFWVRSNNFTIMPTIDVKSHPYAVIGSDLRVISDGTVSAGSALNTICNFVSSSPDYAQVQAWNKSANNNASTDFVASCDTTTETTGYGNFGINSSTYTGTEIGQGAKSVYLFAADSELHLFTQTAQAVRFGVNNAERMRISSGGYLGINATAPTNYLHVDLPSGSSTVNKGIEVSRGADAFFRLANGTTSATDFVPVFWTQPRTSLAASCVFAAHAGSDSDTGYNIINLSARNKAGTGTCLSTQKALSVSNYATELVTIFGSGNVNIGNTAAIANNPKVLINRSAGTPSALWQSATTNVSTFSEGAAGNGDFAFYHASDTAGSRGVILSRRSHGTIASPTSCAVDDYNFSFVSSVYDGGAFRNTASMEFFCDGAVSSGNAPQAWSIWTGATTTKTERLRITSSGILLHGTTANIACSITATPQHVSAISTSANSHLIKTYSNTLNSCVVLGRSLGTTIGTEVATTAGSNLGSFCWDGVSTGLASRLGAYIAAFQNGAAGASYIGADIAFYTGTNAAVPTEKMRILSNGNVGIATNAPESKLHVVGFTQLGDTAANGCPKIKMKKLTGTTNAAEGGSTAVAHGLTSTKIIGVQVVVFSASGVGRSNGYTEAAGYQYDWSFDGTNAVIVNHPTNSENILSKSFTVTITYEE